MGPPLAYTAVVRLRTTAAFLFFFYSSVALQVRWRELNQNRSHPRKWVRFENACPKSGVSLLPKNRGPEKPPFWTTSQLNGNCNGL